ncbi:MAG: 4Fe-4S dicluster domain-containing protein [Planctomycetes bacterium]|nr:4Fe-4S dicluster domain-containing protein [Planctomycetota bacterium]
MSDDKHHRRQFFRQGLARMVDSLTEFLPGDKEQKEKVAPPRRSALTRRTQPRRPLRPPGAVPEIIFARTCDQSGECVSACPANAIKMMLPADQPAGASVKPAPAIDASLAACVVCDGLLCTHVCPSGALRPLTLASEIDMGSAKVDPSKCLRTASEDCTVCVDMCPIGETALRFEGSGPPIVGNPACVGCGVCEQHCPTDPKSIVIQPH